MKITTYKLTAEQKYMYDYQMTAPDTTMYNMYPLLVRLHDWVDIEKFASAIMDLLKIYPALSSVIVGGSSQRYVPGLLGDIRVEHMSEDDFMTLKDTLIQPFDLQGGKALCRFNIIETERAKYSFIGTHHIICDGYSKDVLFHSLNRLYLGKKIYPDSWLKYLEEREAVLHSKSYYECRKWYEARYNHNDYSCYPVTDFPEGTYTNQKGAIRQKLNVDGRKINISRYVYFEAAAIIATAQYNNNPDIMFTWISNGRYSHENFHTIGLLIKEFPIAIHLEGMTIGELYGSITEQMASCVAHKDYPYALMFDGDTMCVLYQGKMAETAKAVKISAGEVPMRWNKPGSQNILDLEIYETDGELELYLTYAAHRYKPESMKRFAEIYTRIVQRLIDAGPDTYAMNLAGM